MYAKSHRARRSSSESNFLRKLIRKGIMVRLSIDGMEVEVNEGTTILEAATQLNIDIPTLCYNHHLKPYGSCRLCVVERSKGGLSGTPELVTSCSTQVNEGDVILTNSERVKRARKFIVQLLLSRCPTSSFLQELAKRHDVSKDDKSDIVGYYLLNKSSVGKTTKCILCGLCVRVCAELVGMNAITFYSRGVRREVRTPFERISDTCIGCGACAYICPTKAIRIEPAD